MYDQKGEGLRSTLRGCLVALRILFKYAFILRWVQSKINGRQEKKLDVCHGFSHYFPKQNTCKEEFKDWVQTLLEIGTFGNNGQQNAAQTVSETPETLKEIQDLSIEELIKLLNLTPSFSTDGTDQSSSLEIDHISPSKICNGSTDDIILNKAKELLVDKHNEIRQRSFSFLLKKMFVCRRGFAPQPSIWDPIPESRMEKILKKQFQKRIHSQASSRATSMKHLKRNLGKEKWEDGSKWIKTDSKYIVLEI
ncbi:hypothetical protein KFK09_019775 [Dendrobium nobile]|uniref:Uncharacterized protein n=1 Tax=Dendrobium nobile TaxID=94219 RepID=A0A8T3ARY1_DENNO|nr:hypothetical protein KFK09_019775 [Dendrobium nobile]